MTPHVVLISGPISSGKSSLARLLTKTLAYPLVSVRYLLLRIAGRDEMTREELQELGAELESLDPGEWLCSAIRGLGTMYESSMVIDSARTASQLRAARECFTTPTFAVHLTAVANVRKRRYATKTSNQEVSFEEAAGHLLELRVEEVASLADLVIDTTSIGTEEVADTLLAALSNQG